MARARVRYGRVTLLSGRVTLSSGRVTLSSGLVTLSGGRARARARDGCPGRCLRREERTRTCPGVVHEGRRGRLAGRVFNLGVYLDKGQGVAAPDSPAAAGWYRRAADAGVGAAATNLYTMTKVGRGRAGQTTPATSFLHISNPLFVKVVASQDMASIVYPALGRGVTRSKRRAMQWLRKAAENGHSHACGVLASDMYADLPNAREVGHVEEAAGAATSAGVMEGHDVPPDVLTSVVHWLRKGGHNPIDKLHGVRREALSGAKYCRNDGCEVVGLRKDFKVCPQCKAARYCGDACQKEDWTTGGHKATCGTFFFHKSASIRQAYGV